MAKGTEAKNIAEKKLQECFGSDFVGIFDKKIYVTIKESSGEYVQLAISMTCPKTPMGAQPAPSANKLEFDEVEAPKPQVEIGAEERENLIKLMEKLGL